MQTLFDGVDTTLWKREANPPRIIAGHPIPEGKKIVSYAARGFESMRCFDIFINVAHQLGQQRDNAYFVVVGSDRVCYGGDVQHTGGLSFKYYVLKQTSIDPRRFLFTGPIPEEELARLFSLTDLHVYLTVPLVLSWSLFNALSCGAVVLASDTAPVREIIVPRKTGLLAGFFDVDEFVQQAHMVLNQPEYARLLCESGQRLIHEHYSLDVCLPRFLELFQSVS